VLRESFLLSPCKTQPRTTRLEKGNSQASVFPMKLNNLNYSDMGSGKKLRLHMPASPPGWRCPQLNCAKHSGEAMES